MVEIKEHEGDAAASAAGLLAQILLCADENHTQGGLKDRDIARYRAIVKELGLRK